jgi:hypothetical protein
VRVLRRGCNMRLVAASRSRAHLACHIIATMAISSMRIVRPRRRRHGRRQRMCASARRDWLVSGWATTPAEISPTCESGRSSGARARVGEAQPSEIGRTSSTSLRLPRALPARPSASPPLHPPSPASTACEARGAGPHPRRPRLSNPLRRSPSRRRLPCSR